MSETIASLQHKLNGARDLHTVVRTMKAVAAASIGQYERSILALADYNRTIELGLGVLFRDEKIRPPIHHPPKASHYGAVVFGSDQGLVGQFNDVVAEFAIKKISVISKHAKIWTVGARVQERLQDVALPLVRSFPIPSSITAITPLVGTILIDYENLQSRGEVSELSLFYNRPTSGANYAPVIQKILPLDQEWCNRLAKNSWPTKNLPEVLGRTSASLRGFLHEYLFVSLFRACADSLASENASRLAAMQRAEKNIDELLQDLNSKARQLRQGEIDEELFDVISSFEALHTKSYKQGD